jgi:hypothetical protein
MALESTQPQTEMSTRNLAEGKGRPARKADNLTAICEPTVKKMLEPRRLPPLCASTTCYRDSFTFFLLLLHVRNDFRHRLYVSNTHRSQYNLFLVRVFISTVLKPSTVGDVRIHLFWFLCPLYCVIYVMQYIVYIHFLRYIPCMSSVCRIICIARQQSYLLPLLHYSLMW